MEVSINGTPKRKVYFMEHPNIKWMITRGTPISGNLHVVYFQVGGFVGHLKNSTDDR